MKKVEHIFCESELENILEKEYKIIVETLNQMEVLSGEESFERVEELDQDTNTQFFKLEKQLIQAIVNIIKGSDKDFNYETLEKTWGSEDFWNTIKQIVSRETSTYLKMKIVREMEESKRKEYYNDIFKLIYFEHENAEFASQKLNIDRQIASLLIRVISYCENIIFGQYYSKRRLKKLVWDNFGLIDSDIEVLWELFEKNRAIVERIALSNQINYLEFKVSKLANRINKIEDNLEIVTDFMMEVLSVEEIE